MTSISEFLQEKDPTTEIALTDLSGLLNLQKRLQRNDGKKELDKGDYQTARPGAYAANNFLIIGNVYRHSEGKFILGCSSEEEARSLLPILYKLAGLDTDLINRAGIIPKIAYPSSYSYQEKNSKTTVQHGIDIPQNLREKILGNIATIFEFKEAAIQALEAKDMQGAHDNRELCMEAMKDAGLNIGECGFLIGMPGTAKQASISRA